VLCLLDDPLAALDAGVGAALQSECVLGLLAGTTRVLATHHLHLLRQAGSVALMEHGRVVLQGAWGPQLAEGIERLPPPEDDAGATAAAPAAPASIASAESTGGELGGGLGGVRAGERREDEQSAALLRRILLQYLAGGGGVHTDASGAASPSPSSAPSAPDAVSSPLAADMPQAADAAAAAEGEGLPTNPAVGTAPAPGAGGAGTQPSDSIISEEDGGAGAVSGRTYAVYWRFWKEAAAEAAAARQLASRRAVAPAAAPPTPLQPPPRPGSGGSADAGEGAEDAGALSARYPHAWVPDTLFLVALLAGGAAAFVAVGGWLAHWAALDPASQAAPGPALAYAALVAAALGLAVWRTVAFTGRTVAASGRLHDAAFARVLRAPAAFFDANPSGRVLARFSRDVQTMDERLPLVACDVFLQAGRVAGVLTLVCAGNPVLLAAVPPLAWAFVALRRGFARTSRALKRLEAVSRSPALALYAETLAGLPSIRAAGYGRTLHAALRPPWTAMRPRGQPFTTRRAGWRCGWMRSAWRFWRPPPPAPCLREGGCRRPRPPCP